jgi:hypothetical protein
MTSFGEAYRKLFYPSVRDVYKIVQVPVTEFVSPNASWTKKQITDEVNDHLDTHYNLPLKESMITDIQAQDFAVKYHKWLTECVDRNPEDNLESESRWVTDWYIDVTRQFFTEET